jgi:hypothetical protein
MPADTQVAIARRLRQYPARLIARLAASRTRIRAACAVVALFVGSDNGVAAIR